MHELSICQSIVRQLEQLAQDNHARSISRVIVDIGPLSGVEAPLLERAFPLASSGTMAEHAELVTRILPIRVRCNICGNENEAPANKLLCSACNSWQTRLISGDEMLLRSVELEKDKNYV